MSKLNRCFFGYGGSANPTFLLTQRVCSSTFSTSKPLAGNTGLEPILPQSKCGVLPLHKFPVCCLSFQAAIPYWSPSYSPTWGSPRYPCGFRGVTLSSGAFLCGARCLLHIRKLETHAGTDIRESNPTHRVLETPSPPWNICPHICPADIPAGAEKRRETPSHYLRAVAYIIQQKLKRCFTLESPKLSNQLHLYFNLLCRQCQALFLGG